MAMAMEISVVGNSIKDKHREGKSLKPFFGLADTDRRKKMSKKLNPLVFTPAQFSSCLESGLNIHTIGTSAGEVITPNNRKKRKLDEYSGEGLGGLKNDDFMKDTSWNACGEEKEDDNESVVVVMEDPAVPWAVPSLSLKGSGLSKFQRFVRVAAPRASRRRISNPGGH